jgi:hypothetical protein
MYPGAEGMMPGALPDSTLVRFLDLDPTIIPGATYEYRMRVVMHNPNLNRTGAVQNPDEANVKELLGLWSTPSERITFAAETIIYADEPQKQRGSKPPTRDREVPVQIHKWLSNLPGQGTVGEWWVDRRYAARGEYIGLDKKEVPEMVLWVATTPDPMFQGRFGAEVVKKATTDAFATRALLVDLETGREKAQFPFGNSRRVAEDVPSEILFVDLASGKTVARTLAKDWDDEKRKERVEKWEAWLRDVKNRKLGNMNQGMPGQPGGGSFDR